jgi:hypothetical protein
MAHTIVGLDARNRTWVSQAKNRPEGRPLRRKDKLGRRKGGRHMKSGKTEAAVGDSLRLLEVRVEPGYGSADAVAAMFGLQEHVAFVFVDD